MKHHLHTQGFGKEVKPEDEDELIKAMHKRKTTMFIELIESGKLPLRPGIHRFMQGGDAGRANSGGMHHLQRAAPRMRLPITS